LSWLEYDFLWEHFQLGSRPTLLDMNSHGHTFGERAQLRHEAWASLRAKGLGEPGHFDGWLADRLTVLARPRWAVDGRLHIDPNGPRVSVLAASAGRVAVRAVFTADRLTLTGVEPADLARAAVAVLPPCRSAHGPSIRLPADQLDSVAAGSRDDRYRLQDRLVAGGVRRDDARQIALALSTVRRVGSFGLSHTPPRGKRRRADHVITFLDAHDGQRIGRYLFTRKPSNGGQWVTLVGTDSARLTIEISQLRHQLTDPSPAR
jgi:hypothetical protein